MADTEKTKEKKFILIALEGDEFEMFEDYKREVHVRANGPAALKIILDFLTNRQRQSEARAI